MAEYQSITEIADACGVKRHRVQFVVQKFGIKPIKVFGTVGVYSPSQVRTIKKEIRDAAK